MLPEINVSTLNVWAVITFIKCFWQIQIVKYLFREFLFLQWKIYNNLFAMDIHILH